MKWLLWLLGLFAVSAVGALLVGFNAGSVSILSHPYRIDLSLNLFYLLLVLMLVLGYGIMRTFSTLSAFYRNTRALRLQRVSQAAQAALLQAQALLLLGRFQSSRKSALMALELEQNLSQSLKVSGAHAPELRVAADLIAAECAHRLGQRDQRTHHLNQALVPHSAGNSNPVGDLQDAARLSAVRWQVSDRDSAAALAQIDALPTHLKKNAVILGLRLKASQQQKNHVLSLMTARQLAKLGAIQPQAADVLLRGLAKAHLAAATQPEQIAQYWSEMNPAEAQDLDLACIAVGQWLHLGGDLAQAKRILQPFWTTWLEQPDAWLEPERQLWVNLIEQIFSLPTPDTEWLDPLDQATKRWPPQQAEIHYLAACVFMQHSLWGKALQALEVCTQRLTRSETQSRAWVRMAVLAEQRGDSQAAALCWKKAAQAATIKMHDLLPETTMIKQKGPR